MPGSIRAVRRLSDPVRGRGRIPLSKARTPGNPEFRPTGSPTVSRLEANIADTVMRAVDSIPHQTLLDSVESGDVAEYARRVLKSLTDSAADLEAALMEAFVASGETAAIELGQQLAKEYRRVGKAADVPLPSEVALQFRFDRTDPRAIEWIRQESSTLITNMVRSEQEAIRAIIDASFSAQQTVQQTGRGVLGQLRTVNPSAGAREFADALGSNLNGLTARYETAVINRVNTVASDLAQRGVTGTKALEQMRKEGDKYAEKLRKARSKTIARTERMRAHNQARLTTFQQAIDSGIASAEYSRKQWKTGPFDVCPICVAMQGQEQKVNDPFILPNGGAAMSPPGHPNCRCTMTMRTDTRLYTPPENLGTGTPGDPFRTTPRDFTPAGRDAASRPIPGRQPTVPSPPPAPPAQAPQFGMQGIPSTPLRIPIDDLLPKVDPLRDKGLDDLVVRNPDGSIQRTRPRPSSPTVNDARINGYDLTATDEAVAALDSVLEAGARAETVLLDEVQKRTDDLTRRLRVLEEAGLDAERAEEAARDAWVAATRNATTSEIERIARAVPADVRPLVDEILRLGDTKFYSEVSGELSDAAIKDLQRILSALPEDDPLVDYIVRSIGRIDADVEDVAQHLARFNVTPNDFLTGNPPEELWYHMRTYIKNMDAPTRAGKALDDAGRLVVESRDSAAIAQLREELANVRVEVLEEMLAQSRPGFGTGDLAGRFRAFLGRSPGSAGGKVTRKEVREAVDTLARRMPKEWVDNLLDGHEVGFVKRGFYSRTDRKVRISGDTSRNPIGWSARSWQATLHHETQHAVQATQRAIRNLEHLLLATRAQRRAALLGPDYWKMQRIYKGLDEWFLDVGLGDKYMMKHYSGSLSSAAHDSYTELSTRGMERLWYESLDDMHPDVLRLMLGILLLV